MRNPPLQSPIGKMINRFLCPTNLCLDSIISVVCSPCWQPRHVCPHTQSLKGCPAQSIWLQQRCKSFCHAFGFLVWREHSANLSRVVLRTSIEETACRCSESRPIQCSGWLRGANIRWKKRNWKAQYMSKIGLNLLSTWQQPLALHLAELMEAACRLWCLPIWSDERPSFGVDHWLWQDHPWYLTAVWLCSQLAADYWGKRPAFAFPALQKSFSIQRSKQSSNMRNHIEVCIL